MKKRHRDTEFGGGEDAEYYMHQKIEKIIIRYRGESYVGNYDDYSTKR